MQFYAYHYNTASCWYDRFNGSILWYSQALYMIVNITKYLVYITHWTRPDPCELNLLHNIDKGGYSLTSFPGPIFKKREKKLFTYIIFFYFIFMQH